MRKWIFLILCLLLVACSGPKEEQKTTEEPQGKTSEAEPSSHEEEIVSREDVQSSNSQETEKTEEKETYEGKIYKPDARWIPGNNTADFNTLTTDLRVEIDGGFYINQSRVYYWDRKVGDYIALCGKAECDHLNFECNAVQMHPQLLYDGKLYGWQQDEDNPEWTDNFEENIYYLVRMDLDGSNLERVCRMQTKEGKFGVPSIYDEAVCDGKCFVVLRTGWNEEGRDQYVLAMQDLAGKEDAEIIFDGRTEEWNESYVRDVNTSGGAIYFVNELYKKEGDDYDSRTDLYRYDLETKELKIIYTSEKYMCYVVEDSILYYAQTDEPIKKVDLLTGKEEVFIEVKNSQLYYDGQFFYTTGGCDQPLDVYTKEGELAERIVCNDYEHETYPIVTPNYIIFWAYVYRSEDRTDPYTIIPKDQIGLEDKEYSMIEIPELRLTDFE